MINFQKKILFWIVWKVIFYVFSSSIDVNEWNELIKRVRFTNRTIITMINTIPLLRFDKRQIRSKIFQWYVKLRFHWKCIEYSSFSTSRNTDTKSRSINKSLTGYDDTSIILKLILLLHYAHCHNGFLVRYTMEQHHNEKSLYPWRVR